MAQEVLQSFQGHGSHFANHAAIQGGFAGGIVEPLSPQVRLRFLRHICLFPGHSFRDVSETYLYVGLGPADSI